MCCDEKISHRRYDLMCMLLGDADHMPVASSDFHQTLNKPFNNSMAEDSAMTRLLLSRSPSWALTRPFELLHLLHCSHYSSHTA